LPTESVSRDGLWDGIYLVVRSAALEPRGYAETREAVMAAFARVVLAPRPAARSTGRDLP
jgi:hypothetical protein